MGAARAQKIPPLPGAGETNPPRREGCLGPQWRATCKAANGQCPVCGTIAEKLPPEYDYTKEPSNCRPAGKYLQVCDTPPLIYYSKIVRCKNCNSAFWQDQEK